MEVSCLVCLIFVVLVRLYASPVQSQRESIERRVGELKGRREGERREGGEGRDAGRVWKVP